MNESEQVGWLDERASIFQGWDHITRQIETEPVFVCPLFMFGCCGLCTRPKSRYK